MEQWPLEMFALLPYVNRTLLSHSSPAGIIMLAAKGTRDCDENGVETESCKLCLPSKARVAKLT